MKTALLSLSCAVLFAGFAMSSADARPKYFAEFKDMYPDVTGAAEAKCNVCHEGKSKKDKNAYGKAYGMTLNAKNSKDAEQIKKALKGTEAKESGVAGKTYGDLLGEGKLPAGE
tara:strand:- start:435 stop:776 length:342 start_codon:yes stop_codon:yes gene_type:complete